MNPRSIAAGLSSVLVLHFMTACSAPKLSGVGDAMQTKIDAQEIAGAVTLVATKDKVVHLEATGMADVDDKRPMKTDTIFWIASMTKPITATAVLMLQDEGKLDAGDPVAKYLPEFAALKTPSGKPANLTITQVLTHTSGLGEAAPEAAEAARTLSNLIPAFVAAPMQFEPGTRWKYCQSGINTAARIVEVVSGKPFEVFLEERVFKPLGMKDTTFYPTAAQRERLTSTYAKNKDTGRLERVEGRFRSTERDRPPYGNGGLFSTAPDYGRFAQMLLNGGTLDSRRYLSEKAFTFMTTSRTGDLVAGFMPGSTWGLATGIVREPTGYTSMLSPGTFGHGGAHGTQAWIDPVKGLVYVLMVQRANFANSDASEVRRDFQQAAIDALGR